MEMDPLMITTNTRHDRGNNAPLAAPLTGHLVEGRAARVHRAGDPLRYETGPELRDDAELDAIVAQLVGKPVCVAHDRGRVIGRVVSARRDGDHAIATLFLEPAGLALVRQGGHSELSLGYRAQLRDGYQRNITVDELSICSRARGGATLEVRGDEDARDLEALAREALVNRWASAAWQGTAYVAHMDEHGGDEREVAARNRERISNAWMTR
ncbi:MAG: DUF2213 domain-containing protein [Myxococcota bacterium]|nr:DUF2213 domain-containing protein [Myxococcota bacterium]